jgi:mevalonate pyrophosphate decarboxylase
MGELSQLDNLRFKNTLLLCFQTATLVQENSLPVIQVIQSMQHEDETELEKFSSD